MIKLNFYLDSNEEYKRIRKGGRAIIEKDGALLFSYLKKRDQYLFPGGGLEEGENIKDGIEREVREECGLIVRAEEPFLLVCEYYNTLKWETYFSKAKIIGECEKEQDEKEIELSLTPTWVKVSTIKNIIPIRIDTDDVTNKIDEILFAVRNSHFQSYLVSLLAMGRKPDASQLEIPENIKDSLKKVELIYD